GRRPRARRRRWGRRPARARRRSAPRRSRGPSAPRPSARWRPGGRSWGHCRACRLGGAPLSAQRASGRGRPPARETILPPPSHPLVAHMLTVLRNRATHSSVFCQLADELVTLLAYEATRNVAVAPAQIETPVTTMTGTRLTNPKPMVVPILRAGLGMLDGLTR